VIPLSAVANSVSLLKSAGGSLDVMVNRHKQLLGSNRLSSLDPVTVVSGERGKVIGSSLLCCVKILSIL
jgi:hypothetical protein